MAEMDVEVNATHLQTKHAVEDRPESDGESVTLH